MDKWFDCRNVSSEFGWQKKEKDNLRPYRSTDDERFDSSSRANMKLYINQIVDLHLHLPSTRQEYTDYQPSLVEVQCNVTQCSKLQTSKPHRGVFAKQRDTGGSDDNPSLEQFGHAVMRNIVAGSSVAASSKANVTLRETIPDSVREKPLPKRKRLAKKF
ncbi:hypothetical protein HOLleu_45122 [Holothuria leucospilota]|uniref:Uncharacterized protein n=1 Tax=Holothuria leucospilota TaxID=206669 RepID=A0A9Q0YCK7_HOLLE|nr:hypothetical protein HOLleu_45122 [Holothuria leucospilota]